MRRLTVLVAGAALALVGCGGGSTPPPTGPGGGGGGPDNPVFASPPNDPMFAAQWHLQNTGQGGGTVGEDARVVAAWQNQAVDGTGVLIAVYDDGVEINHPDISPNTDPAGPTHRDYSGPADNDPTPEGGDAHGQACAGVAAGRGHNGIGITGAAPRARIAGIRMPLGSVSDATAAAGMIFNAATTDIYSMSVGAPDNGMVALASAEEWAATETGITTGRGGLGSLYSKAGGNGGTASAGNSNEDHSSLEELNSHRGMIAVAAVNASGQRSWYSERGSNILIAAPSNHDGSLPGITTTDVAGAPGYTLGDYTSDFGGTSSATPLVSGVMALMLHARPTLSFRDVRAILATSARHNATSMALTAPNAAGLRWGDQYGFGIVDADAAVALAKTWTLLPADQPPLDSTALASPGAGPWTHTFVASGRTQVEHVIVTLNIASTDFRSLRFSLTSPSGTTVNLSEEDATITSPFTGMFRIGATAFMNEPCDGTWTLSVAVLFGGTHTMTTWRLQVWAH